MAFSDQIAVATTVGIAYNHFLNFILASCWLLYIFAKDNTTELAAFSIDVNQRDRNRPELTNRFCDLIQIYSDVKQ